MVVNRNPYANQSSSRVPGAKRKDLPSHEMPKAPQSKAAPEMNATPPAMRTSVSNRKTSRKMQLKQEIQRLKREKTIRAQERKREEQRKIEEAKRKIEDAKRRKEMEERQKKEIEQKEEALRQKLAEREKAELTLQEERLRQETNSTDVDKTEVSKLQNNERRQRPRPSHPPVEYNPSEHRAISHNQTQQQLHSHFQDQLHQHQQSHAITMIQNQYQALCQALQSPMVPQTQFNQVSSISTLSIGSSFQKNQLVPENSRNCWTYASGIVHSPLSQSLPPAISLAEQQPYVPPSLAVGPTPSRIGIVHRQCAPLPKQATQRLQTRALPHIPPIQSQAQKKTTPVLIRISPFREPSPFFRSHYVLPNPIVVIKESPQPFGITLRLERKTALVEQDQVERTAISGRSPTPLSTSDKSDQAFLAKSESRNVSVDNSAENGTKPSRRVRRRRVPFGAMIVVNADVQNQRLRLAGFPTLQAGDIILSVQGKSTAGLHFAEAHGLFVPKPAAGENANESQRVQIVVAREKAPEERALPSPPAKLIKVDPSMHSISNDFDLPISVSESGALAVLSIQVLSSGKRILGQAFDSSNLVAAVQNTPLASRRSPESLLAHVQKQYGAISARLSTTVAKHWEREWALEPYQAGGAPLSDAMRTKMRNRPRPTSGCRCGRQDHSHSHHATCVLYGNLRRHLMKEVDHMMQCYREDLAKVTSEHKNGTSSKQSGVVEGAYRDKLFKAKESKLMEDLEARFVARMEEFQTLECRMAIFSPSLTTMILSTIAELDREFQSVPSPPFGSTAIGSLSDPPLRGDDGDLDDNDEEDDDDDVPLSALGKRETHDESVRSSIALICPKFAIRMISLMSKTWGHIYQEPSHEDYAWRWEVFHGHTSPRVTWETKSRNPRTPGTLSFATVHHGLGKQPQLVEGLRLKLSQTSMALSTEKKAESSSGHEQTVASRAFDASAQTSHREAAAKVPTQTPPFNEDEASGMWLMSYLLSPMQTGVLDELLALQFTNVISIDHSGVARLTADWWKHVDGLVLDEMRHQWSTTSDPDGKYCVHPQIRDTLEEKWRLSSGQWLLDDGDDFGSIYWYTTELEEWRATFENRAELNANYTEGIGRFGI